jgi:hypothetical protein
MTTCQVSNQTILEKLSAFDLIWGHLCLLNTLNKLILCSPDSGRAAHPLLPEHLPACVNRYT